MIKKLLFSCVLIAATTSLSAQSLSHKKEIFNNQSTTGLFKSVQIPQTGMKTKITPSEGEMWWGCYTGVDSLGLIGTNEAETYECAFHIPGTTGMLQDATISAIRFYLTDVKVLKDVKVWLTKKLPEKDKFDIEIQDVPNPVSLADGPNDIVFNTPYKFDNEGVYVGFSFTVTDAKGAYGQMPIVTADITKPNGAWFRTSKSITHWSDGINFGFKDFAIQALVKGGYLQKNAMSVEPVGESIQLINTDVPVTLNFMNVGTAGVKSFDYAYGGLDGDTKTVHVDLKEPIGQANVSGSIPLVINTGKNPGYLKAKLSITKVNGVENEMPEVGNQRVPFVTINNSAPRKSVMETFMATWSKWSPRGIAAMETLKKKYGDRFIGIAAHNTDTMTAATYANIVDYAPDIPICYINRTYIVDPYFGASEADENKNYHFDDKAFAASLKVPSEIELNLTSKWNDESKSKIEATTTLNYYYTRPDNPYRIAYILVEDSLHGEGRGWAQLNAYRENAEQFPGDEMKYFKSAPDTIYNMKFNNTAQGIWDAFGIEGALASSFEIGKPQTHNFEIDLSKLAPKIQNKDNLRLIVMVVNYSNDRVINAEEGKIGTSVGLERHLSESPLSAIVTSRNGMIGISVNTKEPVRADIYTTEGKLIGGTDFCNNTTVQTNGMKGLFIVRVYNKQGISIRKIIL